MTVELCEGFFQDDVELGLAQTTMTPPPPPPNVVTQDQFQQLVTAYKLMSDHVARLEEQAEAHKLMGDRVARLEKEVATLKEQQNSLLERFLSFSTEGLYQHIESARNCVTDLYHQVSKVREDVVNINRNQESLRVAVKMRYDHLMGCCRRLGHYVEGVVSSLIPRAAEADDTA